MNAQEIVAAVKIEVTRGRSDMLAERWHTVERELDDIMDRFPAEITDEMGRYMALCMANCWCEGALAESRRHRIILV